MTTREEIAEDEGSTSLDDLCSGSDEQLRQCINWIGDVWQMIRNLIGALASEHDAVSLSDHAFSFAVSRTRDQAHFLILKRREAEDCLACLASDASEHLLTPLIEVATACTLIDSSYQNVREEGMDRFCAAADWWEREAKEAVDLLLTAIEDRTRRRDGDYFSPQLDAGDESTSPVLEGDSVDGSFLGIEIDESNRTISRRGFDHRVDLSSRNVLWELFQALYRAHGETMSSKDESSLEGEKSGRRKAVVDLKEYLQAVELTVSRFPYRLVEDVTSK